MLVYTSGQCMEQRSCGCSQLWHSAPPGMAVGCCELRLRSTPRYRLVCLCFPTPGRGLPYGSGLGLSRCLGPGECLHSFTQHRQRRNKSCEPLAYLGLNNIIINKRPLTPKSMLDGYYPPSKLVSNFIHASSRRQIRKTQNLGPQQRTQEAKED